MREKSNKNLLHNQERKQQPTQTQLSRFEKCFRKNYLKMYRPSYNKHYFLQDLTTLPDYHHVNRKMQLETAKQMSTKTVHGKIIRHFLHLY